VCRILLLALGIWQAWCPIWSIKVNQCVCRSWCFASFGGQLNYLCNFSVISLISFDTLIITPCLQVDDVKFTVSFSMYFGVRWTEARLVSPEETEPNPYIPIDIDFVKNLWVPDIYIYHLKTIEVLNIFIPFAG